MGKSPAPFFAALVLASAVTTTAASPVWAGGASAPPVAAMATAPRVAAPVTAPRPSMAPTPG